jgi:hypothetical protein
MNRLLYVTLALMVGIAVGCGVIESRQSSSKAVLPFVVAPGAALLDGASATAFLASVAGAGKWDFGTDRSLVVLFKSNNHASGDQCPLSMSDGTSGFWIDVVGGGQTYLQFRAAGNTLIPMGYQVNDGYNCFAVTHLANGQVRNSMNGINAVLGAANPTYTPLGANGRLHLGRCHPSIGSYPANKAQLVAVLMLNRALSDAELKDASSSDRIDTWHFPLASDAAALPVIQLQDWNGSGDLVVNGVTYVKNGAPTRTVIPDEAVFTPTGEWFHETVVTDDLLKRMAFSELIFDTTSTQVAVDAWTNNTTMITTFRDIELFKNGVATQTKYINQANSTQRIDFLAQAAGLKTLKTTDALRQSNASPESTSGIGVKRVRVAAADGAVFSHPEPSARRLILVTDSIFVQTQTLAPQVQSAAAQIRAGYPGSVAVHGSGFASLYYTSRTVGDRAIFVARMTELAANAPTGEIWLALGRNDFGINPWAIAADFTAYINAWNLTFQALHAAIPGYTIYAQLPITSTPDGNQQAWRNAEITAANGLAYINLVHAEAWSLAMQGDGIHLTDAGATSLATNVLTTLGV